jgi:spermidine synthase
MYLELPIFSTGDTMKLRFNRVLSRGSSQFQDILVVNSSEFGRCLIIDNVMQCAESDHEIYDREMLKPLGIQDSSLVILGGGDGYIAQMALRTNPHSSVTVVDLDDMVVAACETHLGLGVFHDPRVTLHVEDVTDYLQSRGNAALHQCDGIVCDLTDSPVGSENKPTFEAFYENLIDLSYDSLSDRGWMSLQAGASGTTGGHIDAAAILSNILSKKFKKVSRSDVNVPSFGEPCAFLFARKMEA